MQPLPFENNHSGDKVLQQVEDWLAQNVEVTAIERRLRAAGLSAEEAERIVDAALEGRLRFETRKHSTSQSPRFPFGLLFLAMGIAMLVCGIVASRRWGLASPPATALISASLVFVGRGILWLVQSWR